MDARTSTRLWICEQKWTLGHISLKTEIWLKFFILAPCSKNKKMKTSFWGAWKAFNVPKLNSNKSKLFVGTSRHLDSIWSFFTQLSKLYCLLDNFWLVCPNRLKIWMKLHNHTVTFKRNEPLLSKKTTLKWTIPNLVKWTINSLEFAF